MTSETQEATVTRVVGYEGAPDDGFLVSWGAAALRQGDELVNPATGARVPWTKEELAELEESGSLALLPRPLKLADSRHDESHMVVLHVAKRAAFAGALYVDTGRLGGIVGSRRFSEAHYYVFENMTAFEQAARLLCTQIVNAVLYGQFSPADRESLLEAGLTLNVQDPHINALRVWFSEGREKLRSIVSKRLVDFARARFDELMTWLSLLEEDQDTDPRQALAAYIMKYKGGRVPTAGGLDSEALYLFSSNLRAVHAALRRVLPQEYPFLEEGDPLHLHEMKAASAEFQFTARGDSLGHRLSRLIELQHLSRALEGDAESVPAEARGALARLSDLGDGDGTELFHKPIGEKKIRDLSPISDVRRKPKRSDPFHVLGYQSGLAGDGRRVEIIFFPQHRMMVSASDDGDKNTPKGLAFLETRKDFLYQPTVYTLVREVDQKKRESFHLQAATPLTPGTRAKVTAFPSSVAHGAIIYRLDLAVSYTKGRVDVEGVGRFDASADSAKTARAWVAAYQKLCFEYELELNQVHRLLPGKPSATALDRAIVALTELGGRALASDVVTAINDLFGVVVRVNNTRRIAIWHSELVVIDDDDAAYMKLTERGQLYYRAYKRAGGLLRIGVTS